jgi:hypothetical protein
MLMRHFHDRVRLVRIPQIARWDTLRRNCVFASDVICGSRSAFWCIRGVKHGDTIFHARVGPMWFPQKARRDTLCQTCFFHSARSVGHVVHSGVSKAQNIGTLFFVLGRAQCGFQKMCTQTLDSKIVFLHPVRYACQAVHSVVTRLQ